MAEVDHDYLPDKMERDSRDTELVPDKNSLLRGISKFIRSQLTRVAAGIILATSGVGATVSSCNPDTNDSDRPARIYGEKTGPIDLTQVPNIGPGLPIPWSLSIPAGIVSYAEINGEKYLFVAKEDNEVGGIEYIKCQDMQDCLSVDAKVQAVQGLITAGLPHETVWSSDDPDNPFDYVPTEGYGAFEKTDGIDKLLVKGEDPEVFHCDVATNTNAILETSYCEKLVPTMLKDFSIFKKNDHPYALWDGGGYYVKRRDLQTGEDTPLTPPLKPEWTGSCGFGFEGDTDPLTKKQLGVVGMKRLEPYVIGKVYCNLITGNNWQEMSDKPTPLDILNDGSNHVGGPVLADNYLLYTRDGQPMHAIIPPAPKNPKPDADGEVQQDADAATSPEVTFPDTIEDTGADTPETTTIEDTATPDASAQDVADEALEEVMGTKLDTTLDTIADLSQELPQLQDTAPDAQPDETTTPSPDTDTTLDTDDVISTPDAAPDLGQELPQSQDTTAPDAQPDATTTTPPPDTDVTPDTVPDLVQELSPSQDTNAITQNPPSIDGGCNTTHQNHDSTEALSTFALAIMAISTAARRRKKEILK